MDKPRNPYMEGTIVWKVMEGDWEDLTAGQIAEVLGVGKKSVQRAIDRIRKEKGYEVPCVKGKPGRKEDV